MRNKSKEFADEIRNTKLEEEECIISFDVTSLFTSIPVASALEVIKVRLEQDTKLPNRTILSTNNIFRVTGIPFNPFFPTYAFVMVYPLCLRYAYVCMIPMCLCDAHVYVHSGKCSSWKEWVKQHIFPFPQSVFEQTKGAAMGSPVSPIVVSIYMEAFEHRAINIALNPPRIWSRYVDDTFVVQQELHKDVFFQHINTLDTSIQFTVEEAGPHGSIPFLHILVTPQSDGTFTTKVHRKPTHTDLYLQWDSNHNHALKYNVINTLTHTARTICSTPELLNNELQHLEKVFRQGKYPRWAINKVLQKTTTSTK